jgi:hypothetical protein
VWFRPDIADTVAALKSLDNNSSSFELASGVIAQIRRAPLGVLLCLGPFNYPLNETYTLAIPGLIMGNTLVMKLPRTGELSTRHCFLFISCHMLAFFSSHSHTFHIFTCRISFHYLPQAFCATCPRWPPSSSASRLASSTSSAGRVAK